MGRDRSILESGGAAPVVASHDRLMAIIGSATDAIVTVDDQQNVTLFNAAAELMFGCPAAEAVGRPLDRFIPPRFRDAHREHVRVFGATGVSARAMDSHQRPLAALRGDGVEFPVEATISQTVVDGQRLFIAIVRDVSERKRAEEALRESEGRLRAIVETAVDGIITIDADGLITSFNPAAVRLFGYEPDEVIGRNVKLLMPPPYHAEHDGYLRSYRETGVKRIIGIGREVVGLRKDGTRFPMDLAVSETALGHGRRVFTGIVRDISERKASEAALGRQAEELARSNVELERFAYVTSHDLQEPMRTVQSFAQLLRRACGDAMPADAREYLDFISGGVQRMRTLIQDLLAYSRVSSRAAFASADCADICARVLESLTATIEAAGAEVVVGPLPVVVGDATQLGQVFQNLLVNAIKFRRPRTPRVRVSAAECPGEWVFSVADNGIGIGREYFDRIFIMFQRLHTIEEYGGTGIGLAICKKIVERHGGRIWVESTVGEGSTFHFSIPKREREP